MMLTLAWVFQLIIRITDLLNNQTLRINEKLIKVNFLEINKTESNLEKGFIQP